MAQLILCSSIRNRAVHHQDMDSETHRTILHEFDLLQVIPHSVRKMRAFASGHSMDRKGLIFCRGGPSRCRAHVAPFAGDTGAQRRESGWLTYVL